MNLLILDRDGVINEDSDAYIKNVGEWIPIPGSIEAIASLSRAGHAIFIATNQSGLGRGLFSLADLTAMHDKLQSLVNDAGGTLGGIYYCPHHPDDQCNCRKPLPGLLEQIATDTGTPLEGAPLIGDSLRDLQAGIAVGCQPILVKTGKGNRTLSKLRSSQDPLLDKLPVFDSLAHYATAVLQGVAITPGEQSTC